ncbi:MAG TPA: hypothetical protein VFA89_21595 [Terriglobales bacterium]|nr:hypothetical protein [Terriglobales bacterium]
MSHSAGIADEVRTLIDMQIKTLSDSGVAALPRLDWGPYKAREVRIEALLRKLEILSTCQNN